MISDESNYYNLEPRTENFAKNTRKFVKSLPPNFWNREDGKQLVRSSGSIAANYIEANESLSEKDYYYRVKICRKETKESRLWLKLIEVGENFDLIATQETLIKETNELMKIFGSIIIKHEKKNESETPNEQK